MTLLVLGISLQTLQNSPEEEEEDEEEDLVESEGDDCTIL